MGPVPGTALTWLRWPWRRIALGVVAASLAWVGGLAIYIGQGGSDEGIMRADAAIILGAAVAGDRPSPVFEERIRHGITLYREGRAARLVFTGGGSPSEAAVARTYAVAAGVPADAILIEENSHTTVQNLREAQALIAPRGIGSVILVSDPLHMRRALRICSDIGLTCSGSPTPTSRYRSWSTQAPFLAREVFFYTFYLLTGQ